VQPYVARHQQAYRRPRVSLLLALFDAHTARRLRHLLQHCHLAMRREHARSVECRPHECSFPHAQSTAQMRATTMFMPECQPCPCLMPYLHEHAMAQDKTDDATPRNSCSPDAMLFLCTVSPSREAKRRSAAAQDLYARGAGEARSMRRRGAQKECVYGATARRYRSADSRTRGAVRAFDLCLSRKDSVGAGAAPKIYRA